MITINANFGATMGQLLQGTVTTMRLVDGGLATSASKPMIGVSLHLGSLRMLMFKEVSKMGRKIERLEVCCFMGEKGAAVVSKDRWVDTDSETIELAPLNGMFSDLTLATSKKSDEKTHAFNVEESVKLLEKEKKIQTSMTFHRPKTLKKERDAKSQILDVPLLRNNLDPFDILEYPLVTEAALKLMEHNNTLVFIVKISTDKKNIRAAVEKMLGVRTRKVNTVVRPDRTKKAYVILTPEYKALDVANKIGII